MCGWVDRALTYDIGAAVRPRLMAQPVVAEYVNNMALANIAPRTLIDHAFELIAYRGESCKSCLDLG